MFEINYSASLRNINEGEHKFQVSDTNSDVLLHKVFIAHIHQRTKNCNNKFKLNLSIKHDTNLWVQDQDIQILFIFSPPSRHSTPTVLIYFRAPSLFGLPISMATSVDDEDELGSRRTDSNMADVSALCLICDRKSDSIGCIAEKRNM